MSMAGLRLDDCVLGQVARAMDDALLTLLGSDPMTGRDILARVEELRGSLHHVGVRPGDRVVLCCRNHPDFLAAWLATNSLGGAAVLMNGSTTAAAADRQIAFIEPRAALVDDRSRDALATAKGVALLSCGAQSVAPPRLLTVPRTRPMRGELETSAIRMSSGTTGTPKGLVLSHRSLVLTVMEEALEVGIRPHDRILVALPLQGAGGWFALAGLMMTAMVTVLPDPASLPDVDLQSFSHLFTVPELLRRTPLSLHGEGSEHLAPLQIVTTGAPLAAAVRESWSNAGAVLWDLYGSTETEVLSSRRPWEQAGHPFFNSEVRARCCRCRPNRKAWSGRL